MQSCLLLANLKKCFKEKKYQKLSVKNLKGKILKEPRDAIKLFLSLNGILLLLVISVWETWLRCVAVPPLATWDPLYLVPLTLNPLSLSLSLLCPCKSLGPSLYSVTELAVLLLQGFLGAVVLAHFWSSHAP